MLVSLHVKNMALIEEAEVEFGPGENILTGETGAGKSIVIGAVNLALGVGNFRDYISKDAEYALAELLFQTENPKVAALLEREDLPCDDSTVLLTRKYKSGRSTSKVNGETVSVSFVRELADLLIDVYGQQENQSLLSEKKQLEILDSFAKEETAPLLKRCREQHRACREAREEWEKACASDTDRAREQDLLQYEINEIQAAALQPGEDEELEHSCRLMKNAQKIMETLSEAGNLTGSDGYEGAADEIERAARAFSSVREYEEGLEKLGGTLEEIEDLLSDFNRELSDYMDRFTYDAQEQNRVEERLDLINRLKARYGNSIEEILASCEEKERRLEQLRNYESFLASLSDRYETCRRELEKTAGELEEIRKRSAGILSEKIRDALLDLNFSEVRFEIEVGEREEIGESGRERICFMISMNPGLPLRPLQSVASGGELSRIMLAVKSVMAEEDEMETLIFDEIDAGISGRTAQKVSEKMAWIAQTHQILCITHLAQIASMADRHYLVEKEPAGGRTVTKIGLLTEEESISELARILGGARITETVRENAREMRALAKRRKEELES